MCSLPQAVHAIVPGALWFPGDRHDSRYSMSPLKLQHSLQLSFLSFSSWFQKMLLMKDNCSAFVKEHQLQSVLCPEYSDEHFRMLRNDVTNIPLFGLGVSFFLFFIFPFSVQGKSIPFFCFLGRKWFGNFRNLRASKFIWGMSLLLPSYYFEL